MSRDQLVIVFVSLTAAAMAVVVWVFVLHPTNVVHDRTVLTTPIVSSPLTPLPRDSGPKNNRRGKGATRRSGSRLPDRAEGPATAPQSSTIAPQNRATAPRPKTTHKRPAAPQQPNTGGQPPPPPPAQPRPPVSATAPVPVTVCTRLATVNC